MYRTNIEQQKIQQQKIQQQKIQQQKIQQQKIQQQINKKINNRNTLNNFKMKNIPFRFKTKYNTIIPTNLFTCWHTKDLPQKMRENYNTLKHENPEFNHYLYDENDCKDFIKNNFSFDILEAYNNLIPCAYKSDLWRYCILYKLGGIYIDIKYRTVNGFKLIALTEKEYFVRDLDTSFYGVYNAFIVALPGNQIMLNCINQIVKNVKMKYYGDNCLTPTGPALLKTFFTSQERNNMELYLETCKVEDVINTFYICYHKNIILGRYKEYYQEQKKHQKNLRYSALWDNRNIYIN
jgi:mannosyltransferase OCH1-like enzyme